MFRLFACPRCRRARLVEPGRKSMSCGSCSRTLDLAELRPQWQGASLDEGRRVLGAVNARLDGREAEFAVGLIPPAPRARRHDGPVEAAAAAGRGGRGQAERADRVARALAAASADGEFSEGELAEALRVAGVPGGKAKDHLARMLATNVLYEPRAGRLKAF